MPFVLEHMASLCSYMCGLYPILKYSIMTIFCGQLKGCRKPTNKHITCREEYHACTKQPRHTLDACFDLECNIEKVGKGLDLWDYIIHDL